MQQVHRTWTETAVLRSTRARPGSDVRRTVRQTWLGFSALWLLGIVVLFVITELTRLRTPIGSWFTKIMQLFGLI